MGEENSHCCLCCCLLQSVPAAGNQLTNLLYACLAVPPGPLFISSGLPSPWVQMSFSARQCAGGSQAVRLGLQRRTLPSFSIPSFSLAPQSPVPAFSLQPLSQPLYPSSSLLSTLSASSLSLSFLFQPQPLPAPALSPQP